jgi:hypothetical protein
MLDYNKATKDLLALRRRGPQLPAAAEDRAPTKAAVEEAKQAFLAEIETATKETDRLGQEAFDAYRLRFSETFQTTLEWADATAILKNLQLKRNNKSPYRALLTAYLRKIDTIKNVSVPQFAALWASAQGSKWEASLRAQLKDVKTLEAFDKVASKFVNERDKELATGAAKWEEPAPGQAGAADGHQNCRICGADDHFSNDCPKAGTGSYAAALTAGGQGSSHAPRASKEKEKDKEKPLTQSEVKKLFNELVRKTKRQPAQTVGGQRHTNGHGHRDRESGSDSDDRSSKIVCHKCGGKGHIAKDCPTKHKPRADVGAAAADPKDKKNGRGASSHPDSSDSDEEK